MNRKLLVLVAVATGIVAAAQACDMCGCSINTQYLGIMPNQYRHFIGVQYTFASFTTDQPSGGVGSETEHAAEQVNTVQLWGRYAVGKRWQLFAFVPYHQKTGIDEGVNIRTSGLGDATLLVNYKLADAAIAHGPTKHLLLAGGGIKLPTGKYIGISELDEKGLPNVQAGSGSWDFVTNINYTLWRQRKGLNADIAYNLTTANSDAYKYGNRLTASLMGFINCVANRLTVLPQAGMRYEYALKDYDNYPKKWLNTSSGGGLMMAAVGLQVYYKHMGARAIYSIPVQQQIAKGQVTASPRCEAAVFYSF